MKGRLLKEILLIVPLNKCNPKRSQFVLSLKAVEIHTNLFAHWNWNTGVPCKVRYGPPLKYYRVCAQVLICHRPSAVWGCSVFYSATNNLFCPARRTHWQMFLPLGIYLLGVMDVKGPQMSGAITTRAAAKVARLSRNGTGHNWNRWFWRVLCGQAISHSGD